MDSSSFPQRKHPFSTTQPLFWILSKEKIILQAASLPKIPAFGGIQTFQINLERNSTSLLCSQASNNSLTINLLSLAPTHAILSSMLRILFPCNSDRSPCVTYQKKKKKSAKTKTYRKKEERSPCVSSIPSHSLTKFGALQPSPKEP